MTMIENPILRGFNPDPNILRVEDDYYIVTSTFEWFPGYQIHHSRDLKNWRLLTRPIDRLSQIDMRGVPDSCGIWAPCLSYSNGVFYLLYTNVLRFDGPWKDTPNYMVTSEDIMGPWSDPIYLNSSGFDSSLFHDDDGRTWLVNMVVDHRGGKFFGGILLQEYDHEQRKLVGEIRNIFPGTHHGRTEGPHLYKRNGMYYLLTAEGGTGYDHCMTMLRSERIEGPYELHPDNPFISAKYDPAAPLQRTGHGDLIDTPDGNSYAVFLTGRPLTERGRCITGRETAIERIEWRDDGWPYAASGHREPRVLVEAPNLPDHPFATSPNRIDFDEPELDINFQALRRPMTPDWVSVTERPGFLRLHGQESLSSLFEQSLVARRVQARHVEAQTCLEFEPSSFQNMAGLACYYNTYTYYYLHVIGDETPGKKFLKITAADNHEITEPAGAPIDVSGAQRVYMKVDFDGAALQFFYALAEGDWRPIGPILDGSILSDEYVEAPPGPFRPCFTGAFIALCCQDLSGGRQSADFDWFEYVEIGG